MKMICITVRAASLLLMLTLVTCQQSLTTTENESLNHTSTTITLVSDGQIRVPSARKQAAMVYDAARQVVILFGGEDEQGNLLSDTWEYDGRDWLTAKSPTTPPARHMHSMIFDSSRGVVVLFGGSTRQVEYTKDTWEYDGAKWQQVELPTVPTPRHSAAMVYDPQQKAIILFGGYAKGGQQHDFWIYDGHSWQEIGALSTAPRLTFPHMIYDSKQEALVLQAFGNSGTFQLRFADLQNADQVFPLTNLPVNILWFNMAFDKQRAMTVLFGGESGNKDIPHWEFDGQNWYQISPQHLPPGRVMHAMAYDEARGVTVLFGGMDADGNPLNDTWEYDGITWVQK